MKQMLVMLSLYFVQSLVAAFAAGHAYACPSAVNVGVAVFCVAGLLPQFSHYHHVAARLK